MKTIRGILSLSSALVSLAASASVASAQTWASWSLPGACSGPVSGSLGSTTVSYSGEYNGVMDASIATCKNPGTNSVFTAPDPMNYFTTPGVYGPTPSNASFIQLVDMVAWNGSTYAPISTSTITFQQAVVDPYIAIISAGNLTGTTVTYNFFGSPFQIRSYNSANLAAPFWGSAVESYALNTDMTSLAAKEFSGVIQFKGTFNSLSFTVDNNERWHGFTVGAASITTVPEPSTVALLAMGLLGLGIARRRRQR